MQDTVSFCTAIRHSHSGTLVVAGNCHDLVAATSSNTMVALGVSGDCGGGRVVGVGTVVDGVLVSWMDGTTAGDCGTHGVVEFGGSGSGQWCRCGHVHCCEFFIPHVVCRFFTSGMATTWIPAAE